MTDQPLACPECDAHDDLVVTGRWGEPAVLRCQCGHRWTPAPHDPEWCIKLLKMVITSTSEAHR